MVAFTILSRVCLEYYSRHTRLQLYDHDLEFKFNQFEKGGRTSLF